MEDDKKFNKRDKIILLTLFFILLMLSIFFFYSSSKQGLNFKEGANNDNFGRELSPLQQRERKDAYHKSLLSDDPKELQNFFLNDIKNGINDKYTKSDVYFITHRFFDNGGNIYEIYDYVEAHPELTFLKEAESIYPGIFKLIKERKLESFATDAGYYAYLAYVEVLVKHGYTDVAAVGTAANQYAKLAYVTTEIAKEMPEEEGKERSKFANRNILKSANFLALSMTEVKGIIEGSITSEKIISQDILVGINQVAAALRYLDVLGFDVSSPVASTYLLSKGITNPYPGKTSREISKDLFSFSMEYAQRNVPELVLFTSLLNSSTLAISASSTSNEIKIALFPILDFDTKKPENVKFANVGILPKILDSRFEKKPDNIGDTAMDIYSKRNTLRLAKRVPEFKKWLMYNGWTEADFK